MRILGIDPGITTGLALWAPESQTDASMIMDGFSFTQLDCRNLDPYEEYLSAILPDHIAYEGFKFRPNLNNAELYSLQVIGVTRLWAEKESIKTTMYLPSAAKAFWTDEKIKKLGLWKPGQRHAMDALKVLLKYKGEHDVQWFKLVLELIK